MSRTFRKDYYEWKNKEEVFINPNRDKKKWYKPDKEFKKVRKNSRKAKERSAIKKIKSNGDYENENIPEFKKDDTSWWN